MSDLGTLSLTLNLDGAEIFLTRMRAIDGTIKTTTRSASTLASTVTSLNSALGGLSAAQAAQTELSRLASVSNALRAGMASMAKQADATAQAAARAASAINAAAQAQNRAASPSRSPIPPPSPAAATTTTPKTPAGSPLAGLGDLPGIAELANLTTGLGGVLAAAALAERGLHAVGEQVTALVDAGDRYTQSVNRIEAVLGTSRETAAETYNQLEQGAQRTGVGIDELVRSFTGFQIALSGVGQSREQIVGFTETLATLAHISGTTSAAANRAFRELAEGLATGGVNLRQLKIVGQDMPPLLKALADSLHVTTGQLEEMAGAGKLTTEVVAGAVETMSGRVQKAFGQLPVSLATAQQNLETAANQLRAMLDQKLGLSQLLARMEKGLSDAFQNAANNLDDTIPARLERAKSQLAELEALQAQGGASIVSPLADPTASSSLSLPAINQRIESTKALITELEHQTDAQGAADAASAASAKQTHDQVEATEALKQAMQGLGLAHDGSADQIAKLATAVQEGHDVTLPYNDTVLHASQVLDLLRSKATPAAAAIADLNKQLVEASAHAAGGFQAALTAARLKADPADTTGQGRNLSPEQQHQIADTLDQINAAQGQDAVRAASRRLALAQARQKNDHGLAAGNLQAQYDRDDFIREHGTSAGVTNEADQIFSNETSAARLDAMQKSTKATSAATNAVTELRAKLAELNASMTGGGTEVAQWTEKLRTASPEIAAQSAAILDLAGKIDLATAAQKRFQRSREAITSIREALASNTEQAQQALADSALAGRSPIERQIDRSRREIERLYARVEPNQQASIRPIADQAEGQAGLAAIRQQVDANQQAAEQIKKSWADSFASRRQAAVEEVDIERQQLQSALTKYAANSSDYKTLTSETASYIQTRMTQALRQTESETEKLARTWSDQFSAIDQIAASTMNSFVDTMTTQLTTGKASWADFAQSILKMLTEMELRFAVSKLFNLAGSPFGNATSSTGGSSSLGNIFGSLGRIGTTVGDLFTGATTTTSTMNIGTAATHGPLNIPTASIVVAGHHAGGLVGIEPTFTRQVPAGLFDAARRFHTGGIPGLKRDEIPAILQQGEGVFTKGQMAAMGAAAFNDRGQRQINDTMVRTVSDIARTAPSSPRAGIDPQPQAPKVTMNFHNQTGTEAKAVSNTPKFDGEAWVIDTVIKHATRPGNLRNTLATRS